MSNQLWIQLFWKIFLMGIYTLNSPTEWDKLFNNILATLQKDDDDDEEEEYGSRSKWKMDLCGTQNGSHTNFVKFKQTRKVFNCRRKMEHLFQNQNIFLKKLQDFILKLAKLSQIPFFFFNYLKKIYFPKLDGNQRQITNASLTTMEWNKAIHKQKSGEMLGPDGLPEEFYHKFNHSIVDNLKNLYASNSLWLL